MILFRTMIPVASDFTKEDFFELLKIDVISRSNVDKLCLATTDFTEDSLDLSVENESLSVYQMDGQVAARYQRHENDMLTVVQYVYGQYNGKFAIFLQVNQAMMTLQSDVEFEFQMPRFLQEFFACEFGGDDEGLTVDNQPIVLHRNDTELFTNLFTAKSKHMLPVVYVPVFSDDDEKAFDVNALAKELFGTAHVVTVRSDYMLKIMTDKFPVKLRNVSSHLSMVLPNHDIKFFDDDSDSIETISDWVHELVCNTVVPSEFQFEHIRCQFLKNCLLEEQRKVADMADAKKDAEKSDADLESLYEDEIKEKDDKIANLTAMLEDAQQQVFTLKHKSDALLSNLNKSKANSNGLNDVDMSVSENALYEHEIEDVILRVLEKEYNAMTGDGNLMQSRKYHVLSSILEHNTMSDFPSKIQSVFDKVAQDGTLDSDGIHALERLDFEVIKAGSGHFKVRYHGDNRYQMSISTSPSDSRAGENLISIYMNQLFGY